nr:mesocentin-like [Penaeus vannamei]
MILAAVCLLAVGASAQLGPSGVISPDGNNVQFSHDFAHGIKLIGPSGVVSTAGNLQLTAGQARLHNAVRSKRSAVFGPSGIVMPDGRNVQFTPAEADNIVTVGPSGVVRKDGNNIQLDGHGVPITKRSLPRGVFGYSGIVMPDGRNVQFTREQAENIILVGPSGVVTRDGKNIQLNDQGVPRARRSAVFGPSGIVMPDGRNVQFTPAEADNIVTVGPSGVVRKDGNNIQLDGHGVPITKRSLQRGVFGYSGIVMPDGRNVQFTREQAENILLVGPSGVVTKDGKNIQLNDQGVPAN